MCDVPAAADAIDSKTPPQASVENATHRNAAIDVQAVPRQGAVEDATRPNAAEDMASWSTADWLQTEATHSSANISAPSNNATRKNTTSGKELPLKRESEKKKNRQKKKPVGGTKKGPPTSSVALDGGDIWAGSRLSDDELADLVDNATSTRVARPVTAQWFPGRRWLWGQWSGTIVRAVLPREVLLTTLFATLLSVVICVKPASIDVTQQLRGVQRVWVLCSGLVSFALSFFLSKAYTLWRSVYASSRSVQNRLNDIGLLCASAAARGQGDGTGFSPEADTMLRYMARMCRLYSVFLYASLTRRLAPLLSPKGLRALAQSDEITNKEYQMLIQTSRQDLTVLLWISLTLRAALKDGRLDSTYDRTIQTKVLELRGHSASIRDELSGRIPLAYTHLMQLLCDLLVLFTPLALSASVGGVACVFSSALVALFYSSVLKLAKHFCDPYDNEQYDGQTNGIAINVECLVQETNLNSERWRTSATWLPDAARPVPAKQPPARASFSLLPPSWGGADVIDM